MTSIHAIRSARILALLAIIAWGLILFPQPTPIIIAGAVASLTLPLYRYLRARMPMVFAICSYFAVLALCIIIPVLIITILVAPQAVSGYKTILHWSSNGFQMPHALEEYWEALSPYLLKIPGLEELVNELTTNFHDMLNVLMRTLLSGSINFAGDAVQIFFKIFLIVFISGLAVVYAPTFYKLAVRITALPEECVGRFIVAIHRAVRSIFIGIFLVAFTQGVLLGIGFALLNISDAAFWGLLGTIVGIVPVVGTALIWVPMAITVWVSGELTVAIGIVLWCMLVVGGSDNFLRPLLLQTGIETSMLVLLLSILCGIIAFGAVGLIVGPVLCAFALQAVKESDFLFNQKGKVA